MPEGKKELTSEEKYKRQKKVDIILGISAGVIIVACLSWAIIPSVATSYKGDLMDAVATMKYVQHKYSDSSFSIDDKEIHLDYYKKIDDQMAETIDFDYRKKPWTLTINKNEAGVETNTVITTDATNKYYISVNDSGFSETNTAIVDGYIAEGWDRYYLMTRQRLDIDNIDNDVNIMEKLLHKDNKITSSDFRLDKKNKGTISASMKGDLGTLSNGDKLTYLNFNYKNYLLKKYTYTVVSGGVTTKIGYTFSFN